MLRNGNKYLLMLVSIIMLTRALASQEHHLYRHRIANLYSPSNRGHIMVLW